MIKPLSYLFSTIKALKSPRALASPEIPNKLYRRIYVRPSGLTLIQQLDLYLTSEQHSKQFNTDLIMFQYSSFCLHFWLLKHRLQQQPWYSLKPRLVLNSLTRLANEFTKDHVYLYDDIFNVQVFYQLKRIQQTIHWSLDDYFKYGFKEKPLEQIINQDICIEENQEIEDKLPEYIHRHMEYLKGLSFKQIAEEHIDWGLIQTQSPASDPTSPGNDREQQKQTST